MCRSRIKSRNRILNWGCDKKPRSRILKRGVISREAELFPIFKMVYGI